MTHAKKVARRDRIDQLANILKRIEKNQEQMTLTDLGKEAGVTLETLRYYLEEIEVDAFYDEDLQRAYQYFLTHIKTKRGRKRT